jgi:hypothetical protein
MVDILLQCNRPQYASGEFRFSTFEELLHWLVKIKSLAKGQAGLWVYELAKDGHLEVSLGTRVDLNMECNFQDSFLAREVAITTGLLRTRGLSEIPTKSSDVELAFARELDARIPVTSA